MWRIWRHFSRAQEGAIAVETALLMPIALVLLVGSVDTVNYFLVLQRLSASAHAASEVVAQLNESTDTESLNAIFVATAPNGAADTTDKDIGFSVSVYSTQGNVALTRWRHSMSLNCGAPVGIDSKLPVDGRDVIVTGTCMFWKPVISGVFGIPDRFMAQYAVSAPRRSETLECPTCSN